MIVDYALWAAGGGGRGRMLKYDTIHNYKGNL